MSLLSNSSGPAQLEAGACIPNLPHASSTSPTHYEHESGMLDKDVPSGLKAMKD